MIWIVATTLLACGIYLSAFFSGSETGFYRVSRVRLAMDARIGNRASQWLFWIVNHPGWFVATTLVGNNVANYMTSLAIVLAAGHVFVGGGHKAELLGTLLLSPIVFVLGELLPKHLFYEAPNRLLRRSTPQLVAFAAILSPVSVVLAGISNLLGRVAGHTPQWDGTVLGRHHLERLLHEGHEEGLLLACQRQLIQGVFDTVTRSVTTAMTPLNRVVGVSENADPRSVRRLAKRHQLSNVPVRSARSANEWIGYLSIAEFTLHGGTLGDALHPLTRLDASESHLQALRHLQSSGERLGLVVDTEGAPMGIVSDSALIEPMFRSAS